MTGRSTGANVITRIPKSVPTGPARYWSIVAVAGNTMPPRDPNDDDDDDEDENGGAESDDEPAVIREPDE
jgi:hypothetical protein